MNRQGEIILSIIIVNYNGMKYLADCIESVSKRISVKHEIIIVDNGSTDGSINYIENDYHEVVLVDCKENKGFAHGNNIGAERSRGRYLLLLNYDTVLFSDVEAAIEILNARGDVGVVGAKMLDKKRQYRYSAGHFPTPLRVFLISRIYKKDGPFAHGVFPEHMLSEGYTVDWVEASFLLTRKSLWEKARGMDIDYFMYGEDVDYCKKLYDLGYQSVYCPAVEYIHYGGYSAERFPMTVNGLRRFNKKYNGGIYFHLFKFVLNFGLAIRIGFYNMLYLFSGNRVYKETGDAVVKAIKVNDRKSD